MNKDRTRAMTVAGLMRQAARYNANRIAVIEGARSLTFSEAFDRGVRLANGLLAKGFAPAIVSRFSRTTALSHKICFLGQH